MRNLIKVEYATASVLNRQVTFFIRRARICLAYVVFGFDTITAAPMLLVLLLPPPHSIHHLVCPVPSSSSSTGL